MKTMPRMTTEYDRGDAWTDNRVLWDEESVRMIKKMRKM